MIAFGRFYFNSRMSKLSCIYLENMDFLIFTDMSLNDGVDVTDQVPAPKVPDDY